MDAVPDTEFRTKLKKPGQAVARILGLLLLAAAVAKLSSFREWVPSDSRGAIPAALKLALVGYEIVLGFWLFSGIGTRWALKTAAVTFLVFAGATLGMVAHGTRECGCFGALSVPPWVTFWIDVAALTAALFAILGEHRGFRARVLLTAFSIAAAGFGTALVIAPSRPSPQASEAGATWPPSGAVDLAADLSKGRWVVLLYDSSCHRCESLAASYAQEASEWDTRGKACKLALLDANDPDNPETGLASEAVVRGRLLKTSLYPSSPLLLLLDQGRVLAVRDGWATVDWSKTPFAFLET
jgi:hypothetical protein